MDGVVRDHARPEEPGLGDPGVEVVQLGPRTGVENVNSDEAQRDRPYVPIAASDRTLHEAHVVELVRERQRLASPSVAALAFAADEGDAGRPLEVVDRGRIGVRPREDWRSLDVRED